MGKSLSLRFIDIYECLFHRKTYEITQAMRCFYGQFIDAGDLCFDVGANMGNRTRIFRDLGARVVAVEPQDACMRQLRRIFGRDRDVTLVAKALGDSEGEADLMVGEEHTLSTLSPDWIERTQSSGRFSSHHWSETVTVPVTTLDLLMAEYGVPVFIKIDVEGFERAVLRGMTRPGPAVSFEFAAEFLDSTRECCEYLAGLGDYRFNYSRQESMTFALDAWVSAEEIMKTITAEPDTMVFGDVYGRVDSRP